MRKWAPCVLLLLLAVSAPASPVNALVEPCGAPAFTSSGLYFQNFEQLEYDEEGKVAYHFQLNAPYSDGRSFRLITTYIDDECNSASVTQFDTVTIPAGVTQWSMRLDSPTQMSLWDDDHKVIIASFSIPEYPRYTRVRFQGVTMDSLSGFGARTVRLFAEGEPPEFENTVDTPEGCSAISAAGYYFNTYQRAEYVDGLLRVHLRLSTPYNDGRPFQTFVFTANELCERIQPNFTLKDAAFPPHMRYFSFRMISPTEWQLWDDESDVPISCPGCSGAIEPGSPYVYLFGRVDFGASSFSATPFPPTREDVTCSVDCFSNVLFLPGIEGSRLYRPDYAGGTERLWEPGNTEDVRDLFLNQNGESMRDDIYAKEGDIIDELPVVGSNIYLSLIETMDGLVEDESINDWTAAPYDWRLSLDEILTNGAQVEDRLYYGGLLSATSSPYIIQELRRLAATSKSEKVTIIAHSNGGLVAKQLTEILGEEASELIDKMIFVAVPQVGTPAAIAAGLHGYDQDILQGLILSNETARTFASTSPMFYNLLPSAGYFESIESPVISFDASLPEWSERYSTDIQSGAALRHFMTDTYGRVDAQTGSIDEPIQMHTALYEKSEVVHANLDSWVPPTEIELIQIAGWGVPKTVSGISYKDRGDGMRPDINFTIDGDGTVVAPSALWTSDPPNVKRYWVDINSFNNTHFLPIVLSQFFSIGHANILTIPELVLFISDELTDIQESLSVYKYLKIEEPSSDESRLEYALHSPLTLDLYDDLGRHTGISTTTGFIEEQIPGTYFAQIGDVKYIFTEATSSLHIVMDGYATSTFTFEAKEFQGDTLIASTTWKDMPTTPETRAVINTTLDLD